MKTVQEVRNFPQKIRVGNVLQGRFFICPKIKGKGYRLNQQRTGFTVKYDQEGKQRKSALQRIERVKIFLREFERLGVLFSWKIKAVVASAEAKLLFPEAVKPPLVPPEICGFQTISTYESLDKKEIGRFWNLYMKKPWLALPREIIEQEYPHVAAVLSHTRASKNLVHDFIKRVFAEYALEGIWFSENKFGTKPFGPNPIILGVESPGVPSLINAALSREKQIPVVQLK